MTSRIVVCVALILASPLPSPLQRAAIAQEALVLSGGGARGLAHAGVLAGVEELGYDPEIVVGTSMGALIGALYAAGYDSDRIQERILAIDWNDIFTPTPVVFGPDRSVRYPLISLDIDLEQFRAARGLIGQWRINRALTRLLFDANARARGNFDRLPRRYRAVATDLATGGIVVLAEGDIALAARASMAVPGFFAPVTWDDGTILVDGGISNNLPIDVARSLGATRVVAADVSLPPPEIESMAPLAVLNRGLGLMLENIRRDSSPADALVLPDIDPALTGASFPADPRPLFDTGLAAARSDLPPAPAGPRRDGRQIGVPPDSLHRLRIEAPDSSLATLTRSYLEGIVPGPYDVDEILRTVDRLYATGLFEAVWPRVIDDPAVDGAPTLQVRLVAPPELSFAAGAGFENDRGGRAWGSLDRYARFGDRPMGLSAAAQLTGLERSISLSARIYSRSRTPMAWSAGGYLRERDVRIFTDDALRDYGIRRSGGWIGLDFPHVLEDRVGAVAMRGEWIHDDEGGHGFSAGPVLRFTSLDPDLLVVGVPFLAEAEHRWGEIGYSRVALRGSWRLDLGPLLLAGLADARATTTGAPADVLPALGDEHEIPGLRWGELRDRSKLVVGLDAAYPVGSFFLRLRTRAGTVAPTPSGWDSGEWVEGAQIGVVWLSALVNVEVGFGATTRGDERFDVGIGRQF